MKKYRYTLKLTAKDVCEGYPDKVDTKDFFTKKEAYAFIREVFSAANPLWYKAELFEIGSHIPEVYDATNWTEAKITR